MWKGKVKKFQLKEDSKFECGSSGGGCAAMVDAVVAKAPATANNEENAPTNATIFRAKPSSTK